MLAHGQQAPASLAAAPRAAVALVVLLCGVDCHWYGLEAAWLAAEVLGCGAWYFLGRCRAARTSQTTPSQKWGPGLLVRQAPSARPSACGRHRHSGNAVGWNRGRQRRAKEGGRAGKGHTSVMNFLQTGRTSADSVAENIMTCLSCGVILKISCTSARMSARVRAERQHAWPASAPNKAVSAQGMRLPCSREGMGWRQAGAGWECVPIASSTLSHSSIMKCRTEPSFRLPSFTSCASARERVSLWGARRARCNRNTAGPHLLQAARRPDNYVRAIVLQHVFLLLNRKAAEKVGHLDLHVHAKALELVADLPRVTSGVRRV